MTNFSPPDGGVEATQIESRHLIELETLKSFAEKRKPKAQRRGRGEKWI